MDCTALANRLATGLGLEQPAVALTFVDAPPGNMAGPPRAVPSACSFWRDAERGTFYAPAAAHFHCPIGSMVMGFEFPEEVRQRLGELTTMMCEQGYVSADELSRIPAMKTPHPGIVYGPLAQCTAPPDVVLFWVTARQTMLCNEAMGTAAWTTGPPITTGRPGCAALPLAIGQGSPAISFGCAGLRTFTGIDDERLLIAVPGSALPALVDGLERTLSSNTQMLAVYEAERDALATG
jgi:uncharacterized protein (DUF169 family)